VARLWAPLAGRGRKTLRVPRDDPRAVQAWWGDGHVGRAGWAVRERNPREKKYRMRCDTSYLIGANSASNRTRNNYVCEL
jgi:hypothetical protein